MFRLFDFTLFPVTVADQASSQAALIEHSSRFQPPPVAAATSLQAQFRFLPLDISVESKFNIKEEEEEQLADERNYQN